jgi:hypothetical protein
LTIVGDYTVKATCGDSEDEIIVTVVAVDKIVKEDDPTNDGPLYAALGGSVDLKVLSNPAGVSFPTNWPVWEIIDEPGSGATLSPNGDEALLSNLTIVGDYTVKATCGDSEDEIIVSTIAVELNLTAYDLDDEEVADSDEENPGPGAFVHFNLDNDDESDDSVGAPKHPGGDYLQTTDPVAGENDLKALTMSMEPSLSEGDVVLSIPSSASIWKDDEKGSSNLVLASGSKTWDLSNSGQRDDFLSLCSGSLYVEGIDLGTGNIVLKYEYPSGNEITSDTVKYTFIAADCGDQPKIVETICDYPETIQIYRREIIESWGVKPCEYSITDNIVLCTNPYHEHDSTYEGKAFPSGYNCIAWSVDEDWRRYEKVHIQDYVAEQDSRYPKDDWYDGDPEPFEDLNGDGMYDPAEWYYDENQNGHYDEGEDYSDRNGNGQYDEAEPYTEVVQDGKYTWSDIDLFYKFKKDWILIDDSSLTDEEKAAQAEAMYYPSYHGARRRSCGCGAGRWIMFESKCGSLEKIEHRWDHLTNYGYPSRFYK